MTMMKTIANNNITTPSQYPPIIHFADGFNVVQHTTYLLGNNCEVPTEGITLEGEQMVDAAAGDSIPQAVFYYDSCVFKGTLSITLPDSWGAWPADTSLNISIINGSSIKDYDGSILTIGGYLTQDSIINISGGRYFTGGSIFGEMGDLHMKDGSILQISEFTVSSTNFNFISGSLLDIQTDSVFKIQTVVIAASGSLPPSFNDFSNQARPEPIISFIGEVTISGDSTLEVSFCEAILPSASYRARHFMQLTGHVIARVGNIIIKGNNMELYYTNESATDIDQTLLTISDHFDVTTFTFRDNRLVWHHFLGNSALLNLLKIRKGHFEEINAAGTISNNTLDVYNGSLRAGMRASILYTNNSFEQRDPNARIDITHNTLNIDSVRCASIDFVSIAHFTGEWKIDTTDCEVSISDNTLTIRNVTQFTRLCARLVELEVKMRPLKQRTVLTISNNKLDLQEVDYNVSAIDAAISFFVDIDTGSNSGLKFRLSKNVLSSAGSGAILVLKEYSVDEPFYTYIAGNTLTSAIPSNMLHVPAAPGSAMTIHTCQNVQQDSRCTINGTDEFVNGDSVPCLKGDGNALECTVSKTPIRTLTGTNFTTTATISRAATSLTHTLSTLRTSSAPNTLSSPHTYTALHTTSDPHTASWPRRTRTNHPTSTLSLSRATLSPSPLHTNTNLVIQTSTPSISVTASPTSIPTSTATNSISLLHTISQTASPTSIPTSTATNSISLLHTISQTASPITPTISLLRTSSTSMAYTTTEQLPMTISPTTSSSPTHQTITITTPNTHTYIHSLSPTSTPSSTLPLPCAGVAVVSRGCELFGAASVAGSASTPATSGNMCGSERVTVPYSVWSKGGGSARIVMPFVGAASPHVIARKSNASLVVASSVERGVVGSSRNTTDGTAWVELSVRYVGSTTLSGTTILVPIMVDRTLMVCGVSSGGAAVDVAVWLEPAPPVPPDVQTTVDIGVLGSAVGGGVLGVPSGIVRAGIANSMADMLACAEFDPTGDVDLISNPLSWAVGREELQYQRGSLLLTIILVGCAGVVCVVTLTGFYLTNRGGGVMGAVRRARLPSLPLSAILLSCEVAVSPGVNVLLYEGSRSEDYVLSLCVLIPLALFLGLYAHRASVGMRVMIEKVPEADGVVAGGTAGAFLRFALESSHRPVSLEEETKKANEAADDNDEDGVQVGDGERWLRGNFYFVAEKRWAAYGAIEVIVGPLVAVLEGIPLTTRSKALCIGRPAAMSVLLILLLALLLWRHPFAVRLQQWTSVIVTGGLLIASSLVVANGIAPSEELQNGAGRVIGVVSIIIMLFGAIDVVTVLLSLVPSLRVKLGIKARSLQDTIDDMRRAATNARRRHQMFRQQPAVVPLPTIIEGTSEEDDASEDGSEGSGSEDQVVVDNEKREYSCEEDAVVELTAMEICLQLEEEEHQQQQQHEEQQQRAAKHRRSVIGKRTIKNNKPKRDDCGGVTKTFSELFKNLRDDEL